VKNKLSLAIAASMVFLFSFFCQGCEKGPLFDQGKFSNMRKIALADPEKVYLLKVARALLLEKHYQKEQERYKKLFSSETRVVFITVIRPREHALTAFGMGDGIMGALEKAATNMRRLATNEKTSKNKIRLDILDQSSDLKTMNVDKKLRIKNRETKGIIFNTEPVLPLLPDEIIQRGVFISDGELYGGRLYQVVKDRLLGQRLRHNFDKGMEVDYCEFTVISFMESKDGKSAIPLVNGRLENYPADKKSLLKASVLAGEYLKSAVKQSGRMNYLYWPQSNRVSTAYNLRRHAGAALAMLNLYEITGDDELLDKSLLALNYLIDRLKGPTEIDIEKGADFLALFNDKGEAKTGSAAQLLLALTKYTDVTGDKKYVAKMRALARFIRFQTTQDGTHTKVYFRKKPSTDFHSSSIYYGSECFAALVNFYKVDPDPLWMETAMSLIDNIVNVRDGSISSAHLYPDYWLCQGIWDLYGINNDIEPYVDHAFKIGESILDKMKKNKVRADLLGNFTSPARGKPTATRNKCMLALYNLALAKGQGTDKWYVASKIMAKYQRRYQYDNITGMYLKHPEAAFGGFAKGYSQGDIRLDSIQFHIETFLSLWKIENGKAGIDLKPLLKGRK